MARMQIRGYDLAVHNVKMPDVVEFVRDIDAHMAPNVPIVEKYAETILAEVEQFSALREADPRAHAQNCVLFAILSPQCKFDANVAATRRMMTELYDDIDSAEQIAAILTGNGAQNFMSAKPASKRIFASLEWIRALGPEDMSLEALQEARKCRAVVGLGDKTMRMALALYDATLPVYTLDVWMLRGIQSSWGGQTAASMSTEGAPYAALEAALVAWHGRNFPHLPVFVSQWALWNEWGFGRHMVHTAIFGI
jgi:hypothetical protein